MSVWLTAAQWIAAMMTAANLGAWTTCWGFLVFAPGSVLIGASTCQPSLLATYAFLTRVNLVDVWRWLGREAKYDFGADAHTFTLDANALGRVPLLADRNWAAWFDRT